MKKFYFNSEIYNFREVLQKIFSTLNLESLTCEENEDPINSKYHKMYLNHLWSENSDFNMLYGKFIRDYISELFDYDFLFERNPMIRIHYKNKKSVNDFHIDSNYSFLPEKIFSMYKKSGVFNLYKNEVNFWIPMTNAYATNSLWVESESGKGDYAPIYSKYGEIIQFNGANLMHGTKINTTDTTRVSLDFRIISKKIFDDFEKKVLDEYPEVIQRLKFYYNYFPKNKKIIYC